MKSLFLQIFFILSVYSLFCQAKFDTKKAYEENGIDLATLNITVEASQYVNDTVKQFNADMVSKHNGSLPIADIVTDLQVEDNKTYTLNVTNMYMTNLTNLKVYYGGVTVTIEVNYFYINFEWFYPHIQLTYDALLLSEDGVLTTGSGNMNVSQMHFQIQANFLYNNDTNTFSSSQQLVNSPYVTDLTIWFHSDDIPSQLFELIEGQVYDRYNREITIWFMQGWQSELIKVLKEVDINNYIQQ